MNSNQKINCAAREIAAMLQNRYSIETRAKAETIICAAAAIVGEWSLWAAGGVDPSNSGWIVDRIDQINYSLFGSEGSVAQLICEAVSQSGGDAENLPRLAALDARVPAVLKGSEPFLSGDIVHYPREYPPCAGPRFRDSIMVIAVRNHLPNEQATFSACGLAVALLISAFARILDPFVAGQLALETLTVVSRMSPFETERLLDSERTPI